MKPRYLLAIVCFFLLVRLFFAYRRASTPFEIDYEEGNVLNAGVAVFHHQTPYPHPGSFPYVVNSHGPVGYLLTALGIRVFGLSLFGPRLLVLGAGIGIALLVALLIRRCGGDREVAYVCGVAYLCSPLVWNWYPLLRVDLWAILLSLAGLAVFKTSVRTRSISAAIFAAALLTKPTALAAPFACAVALLFERKFRELCVCALTFLGLLAGVAIALGPDFRFAMLRTHPDPYSFARAARLYFEAFEGALLPLAIVLLAACFGFRWRPESRLIWIYAAAVSVVSMTAGKLGSETNHFLEWTSVIWILAGLAISHLGEIRKQLMRPLLTGVVVLIALFSALPARFVAPGPAQSDCPEAYEFLRDFDGNHVLSEDVAALILAGKLVEVGNPFGVNQLRHEVTWSRGTPDELVRNHHFDLVILGGKTENYDPHSGRWAPQLIDQVAKDYELVNTFRCYPNFGAAYAPKPATSR